MHQQRDAKKISLKNLFANTCEQLLNWMALERCEVVSLEFFQPLTTKPLKFHWHRILQSEWSDRWTDAVYKTPLTHRSKKSPTNPCLDLSTPLKRRAKMLKTVD